MDGSWSEYRKQNSLVRTTITCWVEDHIAECGHGCHTARGNVNLYDYHESMKDFVKLGTTNSDIMTQTSIWCNSLPRGRPSRRGSSRWAETLSGGEKYHGEGRGKAKEQTPSFQPTRFTKDESIIRRARSRTQYLEQELRARDC